MSPQAYSPPKMSDNFPIIHSISYMPVIFSLRSQDEQEFDIDKLEWERKNVIDDKKKDK